MLDWEIAVCQPELILTLGNIGLQRLLGPKPTITAVHGTVIQSPIQTFDEQSQNYHWTQKTYQIIPLFHPAAVFYNYRLKEVVKEDWQVVQNNCNCLRKFKMRKIKRMVVFRRENATLEVSINRQII